MAQMPLGTTASTTFELTDTVQVEQVPQTVLAQLERVKTCMAEHRWQEVVNTLCELAEDRDNRLLAVTDRRYVGLTDYCQMQLAALPAEALTIYRTRIDPLARNWYEAGMARRQSALLCKVVDQAFASSYGDKALLALGEMALEAGDAATARWYWERILPHPLPKGSAPTWSNYPDSVLDPAMIRAWLVLASILEGSGDRARAELAQYAALHPDARGPLGGQEVRYAEALTALLADSRHWPPLPSTTAWPTFAGNPQRNKIAGPLTDVGVAAWRTPLPGQVPPANKPAAANGPDSAPCEALCYEPALFDHTLFVNDEHNIQAFQLQDGRPRWGAAATIYQSQLPGMAGVGPSPIIGDPHFTLTACGGRLYARMGTSVTSAPAAATLPAQPSCIVCLDLHAQGRLLWTAQPDQGWAFEGAPLADQNGVYIAMRRSDIRPQAAIACLASETGQLRWRTPVCSAETPARNMYCEATHNLLTLAANTLYYNTNLGAVGAVRSTDGRVLWVSLYPRERHGQLDNLAPHWRRTLNPCVLARGVLYIAPADSPRLFAMDAATGQILWQTGSETSDVTHILGATPDWLIAGGAKLYWIGLHDIDRGRVKHRWPDGPEGPGCGRGLLASDHVLWPTRAALCIFDQRTAAPLKTFDLAARGVSGGNLRVADGRLVVATAHELIVLSAHGGPSSRASEITENIPKCRNMTISPRSNN